MEIEWLGPYRIVGKLGRGGMGTVYQGIHRETGEAAAVKLLSPSLAQEEGFRIRFEAEIETLRKLNHPNIVRLIGFGQQEEHLFYAMELVERSSLEEELRRGRRFDWREVTQMGIEICLALRHAHDRGIIHRDIKPANLLLTTDDRVKLSDFGIARLFGYSRLTAAGNVVGTAEYMAPEQAEGQPVDARSDLYSLGALLYALLARRPVFRGKSLPEVLHKQRFEQPEPLRKFASDVPEELERIVAQLLEKEPARRIPNANILGRRLEAMLQALRVSSETVEADASWFAEDDSAPMSELATLLPLSEDASLAPTIDRPAGDASVLERRVRETPPHGSHEAVVAAKETTHDILSRPTVRNHFVPVGEHELDPAAEDEEKPAMVSWQTWALVGALILVGLTMRWFLQPPSADALFNRIQSRMEADSPDLQPWSKSDIDEVVVIVNRFLGLYPNDPNRAKVREWDDELHLRRQQRDFQRRIKDENSVGLSPLEQMYLEADGIARLNPTRAMLRLQALIDLYDHSGKTKGQTELCLALARRRLAELREEVEKLAGEQLDMLRERLNEADKLRASEPKQARAVYRAVIELYGDKPWAAKTVQRARNTVKLMDEAPQ